MHISTLKDDYYHYDAQDLQLVGERTGNTYRMSDRVRIKVISSSQLDSQIDFEIIDSKKKKRKPKEEPIHRRKGDKRRTPTSRNLFSRSKRPANKSRSRRGSK